MYHIIHDALVTDLSTERTSALGTKGWFDEAASSYQKQLLDHAKKYYSLSNMVGFEEWCHIGGTTYQPPIHQDKDERVFAQTGRTITPLCSCIYYHRVKDLKGGRLFIYGSNRTKDVKYIITPTSNTLILLDPGVWHGVENYISGTRTTLVLNPWDYKVAKNNS
jgi:hypothetical protein